MKVLHELGPVAAGAMLRNSVNLPGCTPADLESAGRVLDRLELEGQVISLRVGVFAQCSLHSTLPMLRALAWGCGLFLHLEEGGYDQVQQDMATVYHGLDAAVLLPWNHRLLARSGSVAGEVSLWNQAWKRLEASGCSRVLQVGYDWTELGPEGLHLGGSAGGRMDLVRKANAELRSILPGTSYFLDLEAVSGILGRNGFYDPRQYHWTKQPFSQNGSALLARHLLAGLLALTRGPKKVLVVDLDNTLWGGVVGDEGPLGIDVGNSPAGEGFQAFQTHIKGLADQGILLAVASKNDRVAAQEPFLGNPNMRLTLDDFAVFEASWDTKDQALQRIAATLNLGLDAFVFFDENPAEREWIRQRFPEVAVVDVPRDPADFCRTLNEGLWFETLALTDEDRSRTAGYKDEQTRREQTATFATPESYLSSLDMVGCVRPISQGTLPRVVQLLGKTNQFNLTSHRHDSSAVESLLAIPGAFGFTLQLRDRFGDLGLVGLVLVVPEPGEAMLRVDTLLLSCRVIARTAEQFLLNHLFDAALSGGFRTIVGEFRPTPKNGLVASLWPDLGFSELSSTDPALKRFGRRIELAPFVTYIRSEA